MSTLFIEGHATRGSEVIELLEMMGGCNVSKFKGDSSFFGYYIDKTGGNGVIEMFHRAHLEERDFRCFTLDGFLEEYPYKVGDKVVCKSATSSAIICKIGKLSWECDRVEYTLHPIFMPYLEHKDVVSNLQPYIEQKKETMEENVDKSRAPKLQGQDYSGKRFGYRIPDGYEFDCIDNGEMIIKPKETQYPKTYKECCEVLGMQSNLFLHLSSMNIDGEVEEKSYGYKIASQMNCLYELLVCRDAYWKMAGDWKPELGLRYENKGTHYTIITYGTGAIKYEYTDLNDYRVLMFPTDEMRDSFYDNFYDLINKCKELI